MAINLQANVETISSNMIDIYIYIYIYKPQNNTISKCIEFEMIKTK
jgi:hypothetical protein